MYTLEVLTCGPLNDLFYCHVCRGAEVDVEGEDDRTPLHDAADIGHKALVELLIRGGASLLRRDKHNNTPYGLAYERGHKEVSLTVVISPPDCLRLAVHVLTLTMYLHH